MKDSKPQVVFIAATNREDVLDPAFVQRMNRKIVVDLPDGQTRHELISKYIGSRAFHISEAEISEITAQTAGLSGRELTNLLMEASRQAYQRLLQSELQTHVAENALSSLCILTPEQSSTVKSPVRISGTSPAAATITITVAKQVIKVSDYREDGVWQAIVGLKPGDVTAVVNSQLANAPKAEASVRFIVSDEVECVQFEDIDAALHRSGLRIPLPLQIRGARQFLDTKVTGQHRAKDALIAAAELHYMRARLMVDSSEEI